MGVNENDNQQQQEEEEVVDIAVEGGFMCGHCLKVIETKSKLTKQKPQRAFTGTQVVSPWPTLAQFGLI